jgi:hypothetical protein
MGLRSFAAEKDRSSFLLPREKGACYDFSPAFAGGRKERGSEVSNEKREIKVTDKRIFTPDGALREEYRFLNEKSTSEAVEAVPPEPEPEPRPELPREAPRRPGAEREAARLDLPETPPELGGPSFFDLVAVLAEPIPIYLGDAPLPDGHDATNLEMARLHIDLLAILRQKTAGNLTAQEAAFLEDLLYRLRVRYVQKRG